MTQKVPPTILLTVNVLISLNESPQELKVANATNKAWLNSEGSWAFVWSTNGRHHFIDAWNTADTDDHRRIEYVLDEADNHGSPIKDIISFHSEPACLIWESQGSISIAHLSTSTKRLTRHTCLLRETNNLQTLLVCPHSQRLIHIEDTSKWTLLHGKKASSKIRLSPLEPGEEELGSTMNQCSDSLELRNSLSSSEWKMFCTVVVETDNGRIEVLIGHCNGKVERVMIG